MLRYRFVGMALVLGTLGVPCGTAADDWTFLLKDDALRQWRSATEGESFRAKSGTLTVDGPGQIVYMGDNRPLDLLSLEFRAEVLTQPGGRAGVALFVSPKDPRSSGGMEIRLDNSYSLPGPGQSLLKTGSLVWLRPVVKSVVPDERWFSLHVTVRNRRVQVRVDDQLLVDYVEPEGLEAGPRLRRGTLAIRGHGGGAVLLRNLQVRPLPEGEPTMPPGKLDETGRRLARLRDQGFSLVDYHTNLKAGLKVEDVLAHARQTGLGHGLAVPCGQGFPVADDKSADAFLKTVKDRPVFVGMHAEGRDWVKLFAPATVARFDFVLADALTLTDLRGRRMRLWVKEEVDVSDPQAFMDSLVKTIETILDREPIDVFANPTYLPEAIARDYNKLWTPEQMKRVVDALERNEVALEINDKLRLPGPALIKMAKKAGVKFTFGADNDDKTMGRLDYCYKMIEACALTPDDLWAPRPDGQKPIQVKKR